MIIYNNKLKGNESTPKCVVYLFCKCSIGDNKKVIKMIFRCLHPQFHDAESVCFYLTQFLNKPQRGLCAHFA